MDASELAKLVNRSGFLFQLAVEEHVRQATPVHQWEVLAREYPWSSPDGSRRGFIDFVAGQGGFRCVFECKRTQGGEWIFLLPSNAQDTDKLRTLWSFSQDAVQGWGWDDLQFNPRTLVSEFCVVRGASDDDKPMLERLTGDLVRAAESLAREELNMRDRYWRIGAYLPIVVTNSNLYTCRVDLAGVDLSSGSVPTTATFEEVGAVRFRKALATDLAHPADTYPSIKDGVRKKERSALVVNVAHLTDWLTNIKEVPPSPLDITPNPWFHLQSSAGA